MWCTKISFLYGFNITTSVSLRDDCSDGFFSTLHQSFHIRICPIFGLCLLLQSLLLQTPCWFILLFFYWKNNHTSFSAKPNVFKPLAHSSSCLKFIAFFFLKLADFVLEFGLTAVSYFKCNFILVIGFLIIKLFSSILCFLKIFFGFQVIIHAMQSVLSPFCASSSGVCCFHALVWTCWCQLSSWFFP